MGRADAKDARQGYKLVHAWLASIPFPVSQRRCFKTGKVGGQIQGETCFLASIMDPFAKSTLRVELDRTLSPETAITKLSFFLKFVDFRICHAGLKLNQKLTAQLQPPSAQPIFAL